MRLHVVVSLKVMVTVALLYWLSHRFGWEVVWQRLVGIEVLPIVMALGALILANTLLVLRWWAINSGISVAITMGQTVRYSWIGVFFNQALPSTIGGDALRAWYLYKSGETLLLATLSLILDRICGLAGLLIVTLLSLPLTFEFVSSPMARWSLLIVVGFFGLAIAIFALLGRYRLELLERFALTRPIAAMAGDAARLFRSSLAVFALGSAVAIHLLIVLTAWFIGQGMGGVITLAQCLALIPPVILATVIPISIGGWGVRESAMVVSLSYVGVAAADAVSLSVTLGLLLIIAGLPGGVIWFGGGREKVVFQRELRNDEGG